MDNFKRLPNEGPKAYDAFMKYCEMDQDRSLSGLSKILKKSKSLLSRWSAQYDWVYRASTYDNYLHKIVMDEMAEEKIEIEKKKVDVARKFLDKAEEGLEDIDARKLKVLDRIRMITAGAKIEREARLSELKYYENKLAGKQNKTIFELVYPDGKKYNLSGTADTEIIEEAEEIE